MKKSLIALAVSTAVVAQGYALWAINRLEKTHDAFVHFVLDDFSKQVQFKPEVAKALEAKKKAAEELEDAKKKNVEGAKQ